MPSRWMAPESGSWSVAMVRMRELLPAPLGPRRPNIPLPTVRDTFLSARTPLGYVFESSVIVRATVTSLRIKGDRRRSGAARGPATSWTQLRSRAWRACSLGGGLPAHGNTDYTDRAD